MAENKTYTKRQVFDKIQQALNSLFDAQNPLNCHVEINELCGAVNCLGSAYTMLKTIYDPMAKEYKKKIIEKELGA